MSRRWPARGKRTGHPVRSPSKNANTVHRRTHDQARSATATRRRSRRSSSASAPARASGASAARSRACSAPSSTPSHGSTPSITCSCATSTATRCRRESRGSSVTEPRRRSRSRSPTTHQGRGSARRCAELAADARAAGIRELVANVCGDNARGSVLPASRGSLQVPWRGGEREIVVAARALVREPGGQTTGLSSPMRAYASFGSDVSVSTPAPYFSAKRVHGLTNSASFPASPRRA